MPPTVGLAIIGDEVLLGEVADENLAWIAAELFRIGAELRYCCVLPDEMNFLVEHLKWMRGRFDWVMTTGGIGATHDDLTRRAVGKVTGRALEENEAAVRLLEERLGKPLPRRIRELAVFPSGSELVSNPVTAAPGFIVDNMIILPGIPDLVRKMFPVLEERLSGRERMSRRELLTECYESQIAEMLEEAQGLFPDVKIGSYPELGKDHYRVRLVLRSGNEEILDTALTYLRRRLER
ncbi:MAG: competence/damage-inducible protein A [bacterium]|nr:MAG: competence/damage-inducible protein A [bacterium]